MSEVPLYTAGGVSAASHSPAARGTTTHDFRAGLLPSEAPLSYAPSPLCVAERESYLLTTYWSEST